LRDLHLILVTSLLPLPAMVKVSTLIGLLPGAALASDVLSVAFYAKEKNQLYDFISANSEVDYGCRPVIMAADREASTCDTMSLCCY
jgi:hypothetical protein